MRRSVLALLALGLVGLGVTGCAINRIREREPWRAQAEEACLAQKLVVPSDDVVPIKEIDGPGVCGMTHPFRLTAVAGGTVQLKQKMTLACPMISRLDGWIAEVVQPAAEIYFGQQVTQIRSGSFSCRPRNNQPGAKLSEHGYGNAVDVMSFHFADGRDLAVKTGWRGAPEEQDFLREVFLGACRRFTTVLGPGSDVFHYDHLHLDLARHDPRGLRAICKPILKFTPRLSEDGAAQSPSVPRRPRPPAYTPAPPQAPVDVEEDPYGIEDMSAAPSGTRHAAAPRPAPRVADAPRALPRTAYAGPAPVPIGPDLGPDLAPVLSGGPIY
jgi:hypothetical protein